MFGKKKKMEAKKKEAVDLPIDEDKFRFNMKKNVVVCRECGEEFEDIRDIQTHVCPTEQEEVKEVQPKMPEFKEKEKVEEEPEKLTLQDIMIEFNEKHGLTEVLLLGSDSSVRRVILE